MSDNNGANTLLAFMLGGVIGAGLGLLYAPKSGKENREELTRLVEKVKGQALMREKHVELRMFRAMDDITGRILDILSEGQDFTEARREELIQAVLEAKRSLDQATEQQAADRPV